MNRMRTCIGCRAKAEKSAMLRVVKTPNGDVLCDKSGKMQGRGAYICSEGCLVKIKATSKLSNALRCRIDDGIYSVISESMIKAHVG